MTSTISTTLGTLDVGECFRFCGPAGTPNSGRYEVVATGDNDDNRRVLQMNNGDSFWAKSHRKVFRASVPEIEQGEPVVCR